MTEQTDTAVEQARLETYKAFGMSMHKESSLYKQEVTEMASNFNVPETLRKAKKARAAGLV